MTATSDSATTVLEGIRGKVFADRYAQKDANGQTLETSPEQMWRRVAKGIASVEATPELQEAKSKEFYELMEGFKFVPGGRILSGAGTKNEVTYFNCYVLPQPEDSRGGILDNIKDLTEIMARGGGVGVNLSSLRPRGSYIKSVNGRSSGPVNWAEIYSTITGRVIQQGGTRRGALMIMLDDDHPDIMEFIKAKAIDPLTKKPIALEYANVSVAISDAFMQAVKDDAEWQTQFPTKANVATSDRAVEYGKLFKAREVWDAICEGAWRTAEPGMVFMDRYNKQSNTWYYEKIRTVNPCVTGDTLVATPEGWQRADSFKTGDAVTTVLGSGAIDTVEVHQEVPVYMVRLSDGAEIRVTSAHQFHAISRTGKSQTVANKRFSPIPVEQLQVGDVVRVGRAQMPEREVPGLPLEYSEREYGFLLGSFLGDGCITPKTLGRNIVKMAIDSREGEFNAVLGELLGRVSTTQTYASEGYGSNIVSRGGAATLVRESSLIPGYAHEKAIPLDYQNTNERFLSGLLDGLFSADGDVNLTSNHPQVRLKTTSRQLALDVRRVLLCFGIQSRIATCAAPHSTINGRTITARHQQYSLSISGDGVRVFAERIGISHPKKAVQLRTAQQEFALTGNTWYARVLSIEPAGTETVYDLHEPISDTWITEGYVSRGCGEQGLGDWQVCNLGAVNLSAYVVPRNNNATPYFDRSGLEHDVRLAVRFLDNVIDGSFYFNEHNREAQMGTRRVGLGTLGLADTLIKMEIPYGKGAEKFIESVYGTIRDSAYQASADLAVEKGAFPRFDLDKYPEGHFIQTLPDDIQAQIAFSGIRNAVLLTQAPTGTTSLLSGVSSGIEPVFSFAMKRVDRTGESIMYHPLMEEWVNNAEEGAEVPAYFVDASSLSPEDHIAVQATIQRFTDSSISKTVNAPNDSTVADVKNLYMSAYDQGCKGVTYYRDGSRDAVLTRVEPEKPAVAPVVSQAVDTSTRKRPALLRGYTRNVQAPEGTVNITVNSDENGPFEVFVNVGKGGSDINALAEALGRLVSLNLRQPSPLSASARLDEVANQLRGIGGSRTVGFGPNQVRSLADAVAQVLSNHNEDEAEVMVETLEEAEREGLVELPSELLRNQLRLTGNICPECGSSTLVYEESCRKCLNCGHSEC